MFKKIKKKVKDGFGEDNDSLKIYVEQLEGFEFRWEDIFNNFKYFSLKRKE